MRIIDSNTTTLTPEHVAIIYVIGDAQLVLNGTIISTVFEEDGEIVFSNLKQTGDNLAMVLDLPLAIVDVELDDDDWEDWNMSDVCDFVLNELSA